MFLKEYDSENSKFISYFAITSIFISHAGTEKWCVKTETNDGITQISPFLKSKGEAEEELLGIIRMMENGCRESDDERRRATTNETTVIT